MIYVTRINGKEFAINPDLIETMEKTPDTLITLTNERRYIVKEPIEVLINRIIDYRKQCYPDFRGRINVNEA
ncbi:MAG: flagellar protein FlbD [Gracilibacter sp. BRH_c7a]|nr:MAG: flagellar protein FlbD [Gracilibacter sp. BRH_c7a]